MSNKIIMVATGYVVEDAESKDACVKFRIGVNRGYKDKATGEWKEKTQWLRCADFLKQRSEKLAKGALVQVTGEANWDERPEGGFYAPELKLMDVTVLKWANNNEDKSTTGAKRVQETGNKRKSQELPF